MSIASSVLEARSPDAGASYSVAGGLDITLSLDQIVPRNLTLTGALTANITVYLPAAAGDAGAQWTIINSTTGTHTVTVKAASGGTGVVCAQGFRTPIQWDGTNMKCSVCDVAAIGAAASGANTDITALSGLTGGITGTGAINFDKIQGNGAALAVGRLVFTYGSDADHTASGPEAACTWIEIAAGVISTTRKFILPLTAGAPWFVTNSNANSIQFIGASGTGVTVATGKRAIIGSDGTNIVRFGADI